MKKRAISRREFVGESTMLVAGLKWAGAPFQAARGNSSLQVGISQLPITPSWSTMLWGYDNTIRYTSGVRDDIYAKAFLFKSDKQFLVITMDVGAIGFPFYRRVVRRISQEIKIDPDAVMIQVTHDHSAPALLGIPSTPADEKFQGLLESKLLLLAKEAQKNLAPANLSYGTTQSFIALNRRVGNRKNTWNKDSGPIDSTLSVLLVRSPEGHNRGVIVNYPTHPVTLREDNDKISADFPGVLYRVLGASLGCPVAYMQGCCGDMIPKVFGTEVEMNEYGKKLASEAERALANAKPIGGNAIDYRSQRVIFTFVAPYSLDYFRNHYGEFFGGAHYKDLWAERCLRYLEDGGDIRQDRDTLVKALRIGDVVVGILPGEILHLTALLIRKQFPGKKLMVAAYSDDTSVGYLPNAVEFPKGRYEVEDAWKYYGTLRTTPDMEKEVRLTAIKLMRELLT